LMAAGPRISPAKALAKNRPYERVAKRTGIGMVSRLLIPNPAVYF
jgi:hypothetical protein